MVEMRGFHYVKLCFFMLPIAHDSGLLNNVLNEKKKKNKIDAYLDCFVSCNYKLKTIRM